MSFKLGNYWMFHLIFGFRHEKRKRQLYCLCLEMTADFGNFVAKNDEKQKTKDEMNLAYVCRKIIWFICLRIWQNASVLSWKKLPLAICFNPLRTDRCQQIKQNWIWRRSSSELKNWSSGPVEKLVARQAAAGHIEMRVSQFVHKGPFNDYLDTI